MTNIGILDRFMVVGVQLLLQALNEEEEDEGEEGECVCMSECVRG